MAFEACTKERKGPVLEETFCYRTFKCRDLESAQSWSFLKLGRSPSRLEFNVGRMDANVPLLWEYINTEFIFQLYFSPQIII